MTIIFGKCEIYPVLVRERVLRRCPFRPMKLSRSQTCRCLLLGCLQFTVKPIQRIFYYTSVTVLSKLALVIIIAIALVIVITLLIMSNVIILHSVVPGAVYRHNLFDL